MANEDPGRIYEGILLGEPSNALMQRYDLSQQQLAGYKSNLRRADMPVAAREAFRKVWAMSKESVISRTVDAAKERGILYFMNSTVNSQSCLDFSRLEQMGFCLYPLTSEQQVRDFLGSEKCGLYVLQGAEQHPGLIEDICMTGIDGFQVPSVLALGENQLKDKLRPLVSSVSGLGLVCRVFFNHCNGGFISKGEKLEEALSRSFLVHKS